MSAGDGATIIETATLGVTTLPSDDLTLSLHAISGRVDKVAVVDGKLCESPMEMKDVVYSEKETIALAQHGCTRLTEIVHNNQENKTEALDRGALAELQAAIERHDSLTLRTGATKAIRSICFKHPQAKDAVHAQNIINSLTSVLDNAIESMRAAADETAKKDAILLIDEVATTVTALVNNHDLNTNTARECGLPAAIAAATEVITAGGAATSVETLKKKFMLLQMML